MVYTREERKVYQAEYRRKRREAAIDHLGRKCYDCNSVENLELNHIDPTEKSFNPGRFWGKLEDYWNEVAKCNLLCHDCHQRETTRQYQAGLINTSKEQHKRCALPTTMSLQGHDPSVLITL